LIVPKYLWTPDISTGIAKVGDSDQSITLVTVCTVLYATVLFLTQQEESVDLLVGCKNEASFHFLVAMIQLSLLKLSKARAHSKVQSK
jgi:hypothetical protein